MPTEDSSEEMIQPPDGLECQTENPLGTQYPPLDEFTPAEPGGTSRSHCPECGERSSHVAPAAAPDGDEAPRLYSLWTCENDHYWRVPDRDRAMAVFFAAGLPVAVLLVPLLIGIVAVPYLAERVRENWHGRVYSGFGTNPWWWPYELDDGGEA